MTAYPLRIPAIRVDQPLGTFFVAAIKARVLLDTCFSEHLRADFAGDGESYTLDGTQRLLRSDRLRSIGEFISRRDAGFPNSIILGANFSERDGFVDDTSSDRWRLEVAEDGCYHLVIPSPNKIVAVIDGQHRLFAFAHSALARLDMDLVCSVFLDIPKSEQASLFATINSTQTPVSKSMTYELFGYNVDNEPQENWSPDKLAVFLARRLTVDAGSPLRNRIILAPETDFILDADEGVPWRVSMAVVVQGILRLISVNPRRDANLLMTDGRRARSEIDSARNDASPLRRQYLETNDAFVYQTVLNFLKACDDKLWSSATPESFITKTIGIQSCFDLLRMLLPEALAVEKLSTGWFKGKLEGASQIDFGGRIFANASGSGRTFIRKVLEVATGISPRNALAGDEYRAVFKPAELE